MEDAKVEAAGDTCIDFKLGCIARRYIRLEQIFNVQIVQFANIIISTNAKLGSG